MFCVKHVPWLKGIGHSFANYFLLAKQGCVQDFRFAAEMFFLCPQGDDSLTNQQAAVISRHCSVSNQLFWILSQGITKAST